MMKNKLGMSTSYTLRIFLSTVLALGPGVARTAPQKLTPHSTPPKTYSELDLTIPDEYLQPDEPLESVQPQFTQVTLNFEICKKIPQMDQDPIFDIYKEFKDELRLQCRSFLTKPEKFGEVYTLYLPFDIKDGTGQISLPQMTPEQMDQVEQHPIYQKLNQSLDGKFADAKEEIKSRTKFLAILCISLMGFLSVLPKDVTNWNRTSEKSTLEWWEYSVTHPPVIDKDRAFFNYIGHPLAGSWYYLLARDAGLTPFQSFVYSFFVSTVIWEYGVEAPAERPSIQDLIVTPVIGSAVGMLAEKILKKIKSNDRTILGSRVLGEIVMFFIDPLTTIVTTSQGYLRKTFPNVNPQFQLYYGPVSIDPYNKASVYDRRAQEGRVWMFRMNIPFRFLGS